MPRTCDRSMAVIPLALLCGVMGPPCPPATAADGHVFSLREPLGQDWANDLVSFDLPAGAAPGANAWTLLGPDDQPRPFQVHTDGTGAAVSFLATLPAYGEAAYRLVEKPSAAFTNPFTIEHTDATIRVTNGITGIEVPTAKGDFAAGPIGCVRLRSGRWVGKSLLTDVPPIEGYDAKVTAQGPVFAELECRYRFAGGETWVVTARLVAGEPVILFRETFQVAPAAVWEFVVGGTWTPKWLTMMPGTGPSPYSTKPIAFDDSPVAVIGPWIQWWDAKQGLVCALSSGPDGEVDDMLTIAAGDVAAWARSQPGAYDSAPQRFLRVRGRKDGTVAIRLPLMGPGRSWMLAAAADDDAEAGDDKSSKRKVSSYHKLMNRYMETPLDTLKDMPLRWERKAAPWPVLGPGRDRERAQEPPRAADAIKSKLMKQLDDIVKVFRYGNGGYPAAMFGTLIPRVALVELLPSLDRALGSGIFTAEELDRVCSQLAFVAIKLASPDYVSPGRGLAGNPNMVTAWSTSLVLLAAMIPDHPEAKAWYRQGMGRLDNMLEKWQGPNGGWLEAPHYQIAAVDPILFAKLAAANAGLGADAQDERLLRTSLFLAKISTPPDPDFGGLRHFPPIGNTYRKETSALFGALAAIHAESNPEAAAGLQWVWQQQGRPLGGGLGGAFFLSSYAGELVRPEWSPPAPAWNSELFPGFGAVLRSGFPGPRETYLVYHQGEVATAHYDDDQGSFEMWGKGRPLCLDWGYQGYMPASLHNRVGVGTVGKVTAFAAEPAADYILGRQGPWTRQVLLVKDADPLGPNYFVLRDRIDAPGAAPWRLWVNARQEAADKPVPASGPLAKDQLPPAVVIDGSVIRFTGKHDVDLDVWLASPSRNPVADAEFEHAAVHALSGDVGGGARGNDRLDQIGIKLAQPGAAPLVGVLYPRVRDAEQPPVFHAIADGRGVRVEGPWGTDHVFLAEEPFEFEADDIRFQGTAGVIQRRGEKVSLTLCAAGTMAAGGREITRNAGDKAP